MTVDKQQHRKVGPFGMWWQNFVIPEAVETFEHQGRQYAIGRYSKFRDSWRLECAFRDGYGNWGHSGRGFSTRQELDDYLVQRGLKRYEQLTLELGV